MEIKIRLNPKKHRGYIICKRLNKVVYINKDAICDPQSGFICDCGQWAKLDPYYHSGMIDGVKI